MTPRGQTKPVPPAAAMLERNSLIFKQWLTERPTLIALAKRHNLSRERVRQVIEHEDRALRAAADRERMLREAATPADIPIEALDLPIRAYNRLLNAGCKTAGDATKLSDAELLGPYNFGYASLHAVNETLHRLGLKKGSVKP